ncbi:MAG: DUF134 domain-containing protein [Candidatus Micrarchaeota archaeon]|nr:DUF134 domain-containing protein [Candidatus Micrarchaeota archaeon]
MPKKIKYRKIGSIPKARIFKPFGSKITHLDEVVLTLDEFEALRLGELNGLTQKQAANRMWISQPTFNRLLSSARKKIALAITTGKQIRIESNKLH